MTDQRIDPTSLPVFGAVDDAAAPTDAIRHLEAAPLPVVSHSPAQPAAPAAHALAGRLPASKPASPWPVQVPVPAEAPAGSDAAHTFSRQVPVHARPTITLPAPGESSVQVDWQQVAVFRAQASERLVQELGEDRGKNLDAEKEVGREIIRKILDDAVADKLHDGEAAWSSAEQEALAKAIFDALFGLGRLQPLVDDDDVENIIISGAENVWVETTSGELIRKNPVASSDKELLDELAFIATRSESNARTFTSAHPRLHMRLDGGSRLAAAAWVTARPSVVIRRHRLRQISLEDLVARDMITPVMASFLGAAIRARKSVVVAGPQGAGKTTMVRALCAQIPRHEAIGTFETEFELHLHELPEVHEIVHAWEARPGSGEVGPDGRAAGEFGLDEALYDSFRFNLSRQIVGEVRGAEVWAMIKAMESGAGSISTTHAADGEAAVRKLVTCAMEAGAHVTRELATSKLAETIDLIVQVTLQTTDEGDGRWRRRRWASEIVHVAPGEQVKGYSTTHVFKPNPGGGPAIPGTLPDELRELEQHGFDLTNFLAQSGQEAAREGQLR